MTRILIIWGLRMPCISTPAISGKRAYSFIVQYFAQLGTEIEALDATGDIVTEDLNRILASVCQGDLILIKQLIELKFPTIF